MSPTGQTTWGDNILPVAELQNGQTLQMTANVTGSKDATWDMQAIDADGDVIVFSGINLSSISKADLNWGADGQTPTVTPTA